MLLLMRGATRPLRRPDIRGNQRLAAPNPASSRTVGVLEIALAIGGLILSVLASFAGVRRGKRYRDEDRAAVGEHEADHRIDRVVQRYALLVRTSQTGPHTACS
jgi:hypothetical protein